MHGRGKTRQLLPDLQAVTCEGFCNKYKSLKIRGGIYNEKILSTLAMAMALGVTASAYAANPFSDVPAGHWAYDSINKLAAAGVIEGYGDSTFGGDKLMTRYEMAQIVAKAMAKGANVDKLAAEFAEELDNLGVRVAALEKKADNVKITGEIRAHYEDYKDTANKDNSNCVPVFGLKAK